MATFKGFRASKFWTISKEPKMKKKGRALKVLISMPKRPLSKVVCPKGNFQGLSHVKILDNKLFPNSMSPGDRGNSRVNDISLTQMLPC